MIAHVRELLRKFFPYLLIIAVGMIAYANSFGGVFVFDDGFSIVENPSIRQLNIGRLWDVFNVRMIGYLTFALNYKFGGLDPFGYHLINLLIHLINGCLVLGLGGLLFKRAREIGASPLSRYASSAAAITAALLFISHPIETQAVTYIVQRLASLVALFYLSSLFLYSVGRMRMIAGQRGGIFILFAFITAVLAMLTKQNVITLPLSVMLLECAFFSSDLKSILRIIPSMLVVLLVLVIIPLALMLVYSIPFGELSELTRETTLLGRSDYFFTEINAVRDYLWMLIWPADQSLDHLYPISKTFFEWRTLLSAILHTTIIVAAIASFKRNRMIFFGVIFFYLALSVESSFIPIRDVFVEHRLYLPSIGFFFAISSIIWSVANRFHISHSFMWFLLLVVITILVVLTNMRNEIWHSPEEVWNDVLINAPENPRAHYNLGKVYEASGRLDEAYEEYQKTLSIRESAWAWNNIGNIALRRGGTEEAISAYKKSISSDGKFAMPHANLAVALEKKGDNSGAVEENMAAVGIDPNLAAAHYNLGRLAMVRGDLAESERELKRTLAIDPIHKLARYRLAVVLMRSSRIDDALSEIMKQRSLYPDDRKAKKLLIEIRIQRGAGLSE